MGRFSRVHISERSIEGLDVSRPHIDLRTNESDDSHPASRAKALEGNVLIQCKLSLAMSRLNTMRDRVFDAALIDQILCTRTFVVFAAIATHEFVERQVLSQVYACCV